MTRNLSSHILDLDPEIDRTLRRICKTTVAESSGQVSIGVEPSPTEFTDEVKLEAQEPMADDPPKTNIDYARPTLGGTGPAIVKPPIGANNFEIKGMFIQLLQQYCQFNGLPDEDPHAHIQTFLEICETLKNNGVTDEAVRTLLFLFH